MKMQVYDGKKWIEFGRDGYNPTKGLDYFDGTSGAPDTSEEIVKKINKLKGEKKIKKENIEYLEYVIDWIKSFNKSHDSSFRLRNGGLVSTIVAGSGVTVDSTDPGNPIISSSGGFSVKAATGTIDDSNTAFTFASAPTLVIVNGATYVHGKGVTISGLNATLDNPVGVGGAIFGI